MAIIYINVSANVNAASGNLVVTPPATVTDDIMICAVSSHDNVALSFPANWTIYQQLNNTTALRATLAWKRCVGAEAAFTITHPSGDGIVANVIVFRGCKASGSPIDASSMLANASSSTCTATAIITTGTGRMIVFSMHDSDNGASSAQAATDPASLTEQFDNASTSGLDEAVSGAQNTKNTAGSTGNATGTLSLGPDVNIGGLTALIPEVATPTVQEYTEIFDPSTTQTKTVPMVTQTIQEFAKLFDVFGPSLASFQRQIQDYANLGDISTYRISIQQQMIEFITLSDTVSATAGAPPITQTIQEYIQVFDSLTRFSSFSRQIQDSIKIEEVFSKFNLYMKQFNEYNTIGEILLTSWITARTLTDSIVTSDITQFKQTFLYAINENINFFDSLLSNLAIFSVTTVDAIKIYDSVTASAPPVNIQTINEYGILYDSQVTKLLFSLRQIQEYNKIFDSQEFRYSGSKQIIDSMLSFDSATTISNLIKTQTLTEWIKPFDALSTRFMVTRQLQEWIKTFENIEKRISITRQFQESQNLFDILENKTSFSRQIQDWVKLFDATTLVSSLTKTQTINEWLRTFDTITLISPLFIQTVNEWMNIFENQTRLAIFNRQILEYTTIFDAVTVTTEALSNLYLYLIKCPPPMTE